MNNLVLKVCLDCKFELFYKDMFECCDIVLFIEHEHRFFVIN